jgi:molybdate transport system ATP-binding protein
LYSLSALSTSQQRLALLARALVKNPPLLILDEPCQGLDEQQVKDFVSLVDDLCAQTNKTLIYVSHYENEIPKCIDNCLNLDLLDYRISGKNLKDEYKTVTSLNPEIKIVCQN